MSVSIREGGVSRRLTAPSTSPFLFPFEITGGLVLKGCKMARYTTKEGRMGHRGTQSRYRKVITHFLVTRGRVVTVPSPRTDVSDDKESRSRWEVSTMTIRLLLGRAATWRTARLVPRPLMASDRCRVSNKYSVSYSKCCSNILLRSSNISFSTSSFHFRRDCTRRNELEFPTYILFLHRVPRSDPGSFSSLDEPCISRERERQGVVFLFNSLIYSN